MRDRLEHQLRAAAGRDDQPDLRYNHDTGCATVTGGAFVPKGVWPADYDDDYLYADFSCGKIWRLSPNGSGGYNQIVFGTGFPSTAINGPTFGAFQPKDALYYSFWGDTPNLELHRIVYNGADRAGYPRPKGATPTRVPLVPAFNACAAPNRTHGPPLAFGRATRRSQSSANADRRDAGRERRGRELGVRAARGARREPGGRPTKRTSASRSHDRRAQPHGRRAGLHRDSCSCACRLRLTDSDNGGPGRLRAGHAPGPRLRAPPSPCTAPPSTDSRLDLRAGHERGRAHARHWRRGQARAVAARADPGARRRLRRRRIDDAELAVRHPGRHGSVPAKARE